MANCDYPDNIFFGFNSKVKKHAILLGNKPDKHACYKNEYSFYLYIKYFKALAYLIVFKQHLKRRLAD